MKIKAFKTQAEFRAWLHQNHAHLEEGIWLKIYKKDSGKATVTYAEAVDEALCYGWIDGQKQKFDDQAWLQRFTPRRKRSGWSKINTGHAERLIREGRMKPAGLEQIEAAKADGRWEKAYHSSSTAEIPEDFLNALNKNKKAKAFFATLKRSNIYPIIYRLQTAKKPETRAKRISDMIEMLAKGKKFHGAL